MDHTSYQYTPPAPSPHSTPEQVQDAARTARCLRALDEMIEVGVDLVRHAHAIIARTTDPDVVLSQALRCQRLASAVTRTVGLSGRITRDRRLATARHLVHEAAAARLRAEFGIAPSPAEAPEPIPAAAPPHTQATRRFTQANPERTVPLHNSPQA